MHIRSLKRTLNNNQRCKNRKSHFNHTYFSRTQIFVEGKNKYFFCRLLFHMTEENFIKNTLTIIQNHSLRNNILNGFGLQTTLFWYIFFLGEKKKKIEIW